MKASGHSIKASGQPISPSCSFPKPSGQTGCSPQATGRVEKVTGERGSDTGRVELCTGSRELTTGWVKNSCFNEKIPQMGYCEKNMYWIDLEFSF
ncbi:hypothetical protein KZP23_17955 [Echinicola marina]|uniref:hypothetical protein n=1 Tax=Echinicola marina TaxID=2859768 RepID=UPI001CF6EC81|nr:hypothetical protein [Echinicola marina]UCS92557.1 hypothetical protein KZP23_17955 [Echinicola marina]